MPLWWLTVSLLAEAPTSPNEARSRLTAEVRGKSKTQQVRLVHTSYARTRCTTRNNIPVAFRRAQPRGCRHFAMRRMYLLSPGDSNGALNGRGSPMRQEVRLHRKINAPLEVHTTISQGCCALTTLPRRHNDNCPHGRSLESLCPPKAVYGSPGYTPYSICTETNALVVD